MGMEWNSFSPFLLFKYLFHDVVFEDLELVLVIF